MYFLSKKNVLSLLICMLIILFINLFVVFSNQNLSLNYLEIQKFNWESLYSFTKLVVIILSCFLTNNFLLSINDNYKMLFIINIKNHYIYYISKIITVFIVLFCFVFLSFTIYITVSFFSNIKFVITIQCVKGYFIIFLIASVYGMMSMILTKIMDNAFCVMIPIFIYICLEFFEIENTLINTFFPNFALIYLENGFFSCSCHCVILTLFYAISFLIFIRE